MSPRIARANFASGPSSQALLLVPAVSAAAGALGSSGAGAGSEQVEPLAKLPEAKGGLFNVSAAPVSAGPPRTA